jgi:hypothetical protein
MSSKGHRADAAARVARNESMFRTVNEQIDGINSAFEQLFDVQASFVCECCDPECTQQVEMAGADYQRVREHGARFVVAPGEQHIGREGIEHVVEKTQTYWVVEKIGVAGDVSRDLSPRD